jgi:hexosaminidase
MRNAIATFFMIVGCFLSGQSVGADESIALVPQPLRIERRAGEFVLNNDAAILVDKNSADAARVGQQLAERIRRSTGFNMAVTPFDGNTATHNAIMLTAKQANTAIGAEGYTLDATTDGVTIAAGDGPGLFYGVQTLLQLLPPQILSAAKAEGSVAWKMPAVHIEDQPRFHWRGLLLDVARHFFNKEEVKNYIDLMAQHKFNALQLHLTDDDGWRIEIKRYPKLTEIGAWRKDIGFGLDAKDGTAYGLDGRYGGFYTQDDIREIVAYAKARYITIVPEIEMPGHSGAARRVYPEYGCKDGQSAFCAGNDATFAFLEGVLAEVLDLFPGKDIHVGGDEVKKDDWKTCEKCQARIRQEGLSDETELHGYFMRRIKKFLDAKNRTTVGWDEADSRRGGVAPYAIVMSWKDIDAGILAASAGLDVIMIPHFHCYFDYYQAQAGEPKASGIVLPLKTAYSFEPVPASLPADKVKHVLGAGGALWSELFPNYAHVQYMTYPRACALAEVTWTDAKMKNWEDFRNRLDMHLQRLKAQGVNYRQPEKTDNASGKPKP